MKRRTIRGQIFKSYAILFIALVLTAVVGINFYMGNMQSKNIKDTLTRLAFSVSEQMEAQNQNMYNLAVNVCTSETLQQCFFAENEDGMTRRKNEDAITNHILSIMGPMNRFHRLVLRREDGLMYEYSSREVNLVNESGGEEYCEKNRKVLEQQGEPFFRGTFEDPEAAFLEDVPVTSVQVAFSEMYGNRYTNMIEVQQTYENSRQMIDDLLRTGENGRQYQACIYDAVGEIVYPYRENTERSQCFWKQMLPEEEGHIYKDGEGKRYIGRKYISPLTGWTTFVYCSNRYSFWPILRFAAVSFLAALLFIGVLLLISYMISNSITVPLQKIRESIALYNLNKEKSVRVQPSNAELDEMTSLSDTFYEMQERIEGYVEEVTALRVHELQSRYYALQSQMNPHFLYNSLSILSIMCDEKQNEAAAEFCSELASMLRYSSASFERDVSLAEEMEYTENYLKLLQKRYDTMLDMEVTLPDAVKGKRIPRLILQPLVENCIKYGLESAPPWFISVEAEETKTGWCVVVSDTGNGFAEDTLKEIQERIQEIEQHSQVPELEIGGMGILNIYIRLKLYYKEHLRFLLGNQDEGGAFVQIEIQEDTCEGTDY